MTASWSTFDLEMLAQRRRESTPEPQRRKPTKREAQSEADVTKAIIGRLRRDGWACWKLDVGRDAHSGLQYGEKGMADWICTSTKRVRTWPGNTGVRGFFWMELKAPGKKPRKDQRAWQLARLDDGQVAVWFDSYEMFLEWYAPDEAVDAVLAAAKESHANR
jgi:hypothetical protein